MKADTHLVNHPSDGGPCLSGTGGFVAKLWQTGLQHCIPKDDEHKKPTDEQTGRENECPVSYHPANIP